LGSIVQKGKFALCALALDSELKRVDFPTFGSPTIPAFIYIIYAIWYLLILSWQRYHF
jgi:hypothetical protein